MKAMTRLTAAMLLALCIAPASKGSVLLGPGDTFVADFDFTSSAPTHSLGVSALFSFIDAPGGVAIRAFTDFGASGTSTDIVGGGFGLDQTNFLLSGAANFSDPTFSIQVSVPSAGLFTLESLSVKVTSTSGVAAIQTIVPGSVPEPATLALLGIGLAGLAFSRRKQ